MSTASWEVHDDKTQLDHTVTVYYDRTTPAGGSISCNCFVRNCRHKVAVKRFWKSLTFKERAAWALAEMKEEYGAGRVESAQLANLLKIASRLLDEVTEPIGRSDVGTATVSSPEISLSLRPKRKINLE